MPKIRVEIKYRPDDIAEVLKKLDEKQRNGEEGKVRLAFHEAITRFENLARESVEPEHEI